MSEKTTAKIIESVPRTNDSAPFRAKDGNGKVWTRWEHSWDELLGKQVSFDVEERSREWQGRTFTDYVVSNVEEVTEEKQPAFGTGEYVTGQKPAVEQRRMCALNAATNATGMTAELLKFQTSREVTPELYRAAWDAMFYHCFLQNLRACRIMEEEDIPF